MVEQLLTESSHQCCDGKRRCILDMACMTMQGAVVVVQWCGHDGKINRFVHCKKKSESARHARLMVDRDISTHKLV